MHVKVGGWQGCREGEREVADHMTALIWLWRERGGGRGTAKSCPVSNCTYVIYNAPAGFSFFYLPFCWRNLSRYKKGSGRFEQRLTSYPGPIQWYHSQVDLVWPDCNPFLFIRGLSCPASVQTSLTQNCLKLTIPEFSLQPPSCMLWWHWLLKKS